MVKEVRFISRWTDPWMVDDHSPPPSLLVIEDSDEDFEALRRILQRHCAIDIELQRCIDGDDALDFLYRTGRYKEHSSIKLPNVILLDLNLPGTDGREFLYEIKQDETLKLIPVVVLTSSSSPRDIQTCYRYGVNSYLLKPMDTERFKASINSFATYWFTTVLLPNQATI